MNCKRTTSAHARVRRRRGVLPHSGAPTVTPAGRREVLAFPGMAREREILEHAVHTIAEQAAKADELVDEAKAAGGGDHPVTVHAKMLRLELLKVKADLERELEDFSLNCTECGLDVHWVSGLGVSPGHWAHREPAPHGEPAV